MGSLVQLVKEYQIVSTSQSSPTIVLVHGAFSDASIWQKVIVDLLRREYRVVGVALPMRGLISDAAYLNSILTKIDSPIILVGHSYGGSVISFPFTERAKIHALVYVAAFLPDAGESAGQLNNLFPGTRLTPESLNIWDTPSGQDVYLKSEHFEGVYAADLDETTVLLMAAAQRPVAVAALSETFSGEPLWKSVPSWALVATQDVSIPTETLRYMARRANSRVVEVDSSHAVPASRPADVVRIILAASGAR